MYLCAQNMFRFNRLTRANTTVAYGWRAWQRVLAIRRGRAVLNGFDFGFVTFTIETTVRVCMQCTCTCNSTELPTTPSLEDLLLFRQTVACPDAARQSHHAHATECILGHLVPLQEEVARYDIGMRCPRHLKFLLVPRQDGLLECREV